MVDPCGGSVAWAEADLVVVSEAVAVVLGEAVPVGVGRGHRD